VKLFDKLRVKPFDKLRVKPFDKLRVKRRLAMGHRLEVRKQRYY
jgi:hypothetical protein